MSGEVDPNGESGERIGMEEESDFIRDLKDPKLPSKEEVEKYFLRGHIPYRDWCDVCVKFHGKDMDHKRDDGHNRDIPEYSFDYCFPGDELGFKWTV